MSIIINNYDVIHSAYICLYLYKDTKPTSTSRNQTSLLECYIKRVFWSVTVVLLLLLLLVLLLVLIMVRSPPNMPFAPHITIGRKQVNWPILSCSNSLLRIYTFDSQNKLTVVEFPCTILQRTEQHCESTLLTI
jgi:hypothetical protein